MSLVMISKRQNPFSARRYQEYYFSSKEVFGWTVPRRVYFHLGGQDVCEGADPAHRPDGEGGEEEGGGAGQHLELLPGCSMHQQTNLTDQGFR